MLFNDSMNNSMMKGGEKEIDKVLPPELVSNTTQLIFKFENY